MKSPGLKSWILVGAFLCLAAQSDRGREWDPVPYYSPEKWIEIRGAGICCLDEGAGDAILLVHGWAGNAWNWMSVWEALARNHRVIAVDLPGHGKSGCPKDFGFTMPEYADFLIELMDELGVEKATVVGSSMGGSVAAWAAIRHPDRVELLVLVDAAGTSVQNPLMKIAGSIVTARTVIPLIHLVFPVNEQTVAAVPDSEKKRVELAEGLYRSDQRKCAGKALAKSMKSLGRDLVEDKLGRIAAPTLVIWGSDDGLLPVKAGEVYRDGIPGAKMTVIEKGNHTPMQWQPEEFIRVLEEFMDRG